MYLNVIYKLLNKIWVINFLIIIFFLIIKINSFNQPYFYEYLSNGLASYFPIDLNYNLYSYYLNYDGLIIGDY